jgi:hypothetical protein
VPLQSACVVTAQEPSGWQHAPLASGQGFVGVQKVPLPKYVPLAVAHAASVRIWQEPSATQHAPPPFSPRLWSPPAATATKPLLGAGTLHWP